VEVASIESFRAAAIREDAVVRQYGRGRSAASLCVIIPAHDEAAVLPRCLGALLNQKTAQVMRVVVVDNGSGDHTADVASFWVPRFQAAGHEMLVLHLARANKSAALNAGDAAASDVPGCRIYLDADVELSPGSVEAVAKALCGESAVGMCCPRLRVARSRTWSTRTYAHVWTRLPWVVDDAIGGGFYAVSAEGRRRWKRFPDLLAEDAFVQSRFKKRERRVLHGESFLVRLPEGFSDLVRVRTRWISGNRQLARQDTSEWGRRAFPLRGRVKVLLTTPSLWPHLPFYFLVNALAHWRARRREKIGTAIWERGRPDPEVIVAEDDEMQPAAH
jgi:glycosyltransferase involved in cell wall biosynthesis